MSVPHQLLEKDDKINELMEELSKTTALYNSNKLELEQIRTDLEELEELRDMKADVERKEKQQQVTRSCLLLGRFEVWELDSINKSSIWFAQCIEIHFDSKCWA